MAQGKLTLKVRDDKVLNFYYYSKIELAVAASLSVKLKNPDRQRQPVLITTEPKKIEGSIYPYVYHFIDGGYEITEIEFMELAGVDKTNSSNTIKDTFTNDDENNSISGNLEGLPPEKGSYFRTFIYTISEAELAKYLAEEDDVDLEINGSLYPPISSPSLTNDVYTYVFQVNAELISSNNTTVRIVIRGNEVFSKAFNPLETDFEAILQKELLSTIPSIDNNLRRLASENRVQSVKLSPPSIDPTSDEELWKAIRKSKFNFVNYGYFINEILQIEDDRIDRNVKDRTKQRNAIRSYISPFQNVASYQYLKQATDLYLLLNSYFFVDESSGGGSIRTYEGELLNLNPEQINELYDAKFLRSISRSIRSNFPTSYSLFEKNDSGFEFPSGNSNIGVNARAAGIPSVNNPNVRGGTFAPVRPIGTLRPPQLALDPGVLAVANPFGTQPPQPPQPFIDAVTENGGGITGAEFEFDWYNLSQPMIELIWSYWMEELGLVQTMNAISLRFQNVKKRQGPDPLANLALDSLRPIGNLLWGYVEDERVRTSMIRRCYEYEHQYGISLRGKAVPQLYSVESRSRFIGAFHQLIKMANDYYQQSNILTVKPDAFPLLNQLKEVHIILREGQHNQFRDLTWSSRVEMLTQQWLLDREEVKEFIRGRYMVPYEEGWMGTVDTMKRLQNWNETSVSHFYHLATNGEQLLLSIRYGDWASPDYRAENAATWAHFWRDEIQRYLHAYRAVTSVDLSADIVETRPSPTVEADRFLPPAHHIERREMNRDRRDGFEGQTPPPVFSRNGRW